MDHRTTERRALGTSRVQARSLLKDARSGRTAQDWKRLYATNPAAVPASVQKVLEQRRMI